MSLLDVMELLTGLICLVTATSECMTQWIGLERDGSVRVGRPKHLRE